MVMTYLNLSWPAVSHICSLTDLPPTFTTLLPNSTPIVWLESCLTKTTMKNTKTIRIRELGIKNRLLHQKGPPILKTWKTCLNRRDNDAYKKIGKSYAIQTSSPSQSSACETGSQIYMHEECWHLWPEIVTAKCKNFKW